MDTGNLLLKRKPEGEKSFRGAYSYHKNETIYAEEDFEVWKGGKDLNYSFFSKFSSRVATGELLSIYVDYQINKDYIPVNVFIEKIMGDETVTETYKFNHKTNRIAYIYTSKNGTEEINFATSPKFTISTPCTAMSCLFLRTKKENPTGRNNYTMIQSFNNWQFKDKPVFKSIILTRTGIGSKAINIQGKNLQATEYKIIESFDDQNEIIKHQNSYITAFISRYAGIPYLIKSTDGIKIQIKFLNDLETE